PQYGWWSGAMPADPVALSVKCPGVTDAFRSRLLDLSFHVRHEIVWQGGLGGQTPAGCVATQWP
ncbi:hypothetical protein AWZ03_015087, partial [Drosophila navojoa]